MAQKRRPARRGRAAKPTVKTKPRTTTTSRRKSLPRPRDVQQRVFRVFAKQVDSLWQGLTTNCQQFTEGFNQALGESALEMHVEPSLLRVSYPRGDAELLVQLDKDERYLQAWMNSGCVTYGSCLSDQLPLGLTVSGNELQLVLSGDVASGEHVAVTLLRQLTCGEVDPPSGAG
jgi:hypothetical protein